MKTNSSQCVCVIGARKGSKRFPGKNKSLLHGKPLSSIAIEVAQEADIFKNILFSTDDDIFNNLKNQSGVILNNRPKHLAGDNISMWEVGIYLLEHYKSLIGNPLSLCFISPCHPFRTAKHLLDAYNLFVEKEATSLVSLTKFPCPPELAVEVNNQIIYRKWNGLVRKEEHSTKYFLNGAITFVKTDYFIRNNGVFSSDTIAYEMSWPDCLDIDYKEDFMIAQRLAPIIGRE